MYIQTIKKLLCLLILRIKSIVSFSNVISIIIILNNEKQAAVFYEEFPISDISKDMFEVFN